MQTSNPTIKYKPAEENLLRKLSDRRAAEDLPTIYVNRQLRSWITQPSEFVCTGDEVDTLRNQSWNRRFAGSLDVCCPRVFLSWTKTRVQISVTDNVKEKELLDFELLPHLPHTYTQTHTHTQDLAASDYHIFGPPKWLFRRQRFCQCRWT
jgi:hypothetical protein